MALEYSIKYVHSNLDQSLGWKESTVSNQLLIAEYLHNRE